MQLFEFFQVFNNFTPADTTGNCSCYRFQRGYVFSRDDLFVCSFDSPVSRSRYLSSDFGPGATYKFNSCKSIS